MNKLKQIRSQLGITQDGLAKIYGCAQSDISRFESGEFTFPLVYACKLKKLCDLKGLIINFDDMINSEDKKEPADTTGSIAG